MVAVEDVILFVILPYVAVAIGAIVSAYRYYVSPFSFPSLSSQLLERRQLLGSVPWHYGIIIVLGAHVIAAVLSSFWKLIIADQIRLYSMEVTGWTLAILLGVGLAVLIARRFVNPRVMAVTSAMDWILLAALMLQALLGVSTAVTQRWGAVWYVQIVVPWLQSLVGLNPDIRVISFLPLIVKIHILNALIIVMLVPFTRLVHMFTIPITYLWRPYQVVRWNRLTPNIVESAESEKRAGRRAFLSVLTATVILLAAGAVGLVFKSNTNPIVSTSIQLSTVAPVTTQPGWPKLKVINARSLELLKPLTFNYPLDNTPNILVKLGVKAENGVGPDGDIVAFSSVCQHQGCIYGFLPPEMTQNNPPEGRCVCHGSMYDFVHNGKVIGGPALYPVPRVMFEYDNRTGDLYVIGMTPPNIYGHGPSGTTDAADVLKYDLVGGEIVTQIAISQT